MKQIPNIFTLLNLFAGVMAVIFALQTNSILIYQNDAYQSSFNIPEKLSWAAICILIAAVIDFLDGFVARLLNATSEMGKQLDSLSDVVSFGVAPAVIIYQLLRFSYAREENGIYISIIVLLPAIIIACASAYRLARFNIDDSQQYSFKGLPVPAAGIFIASFPLIIHFSTSPAINSVIVNKWFLYAVILIISYLMVSRHRMIALKFSKYSGIEFYAMLVVAIIGAVVAVVWHWLALPVVILLYVLLSLILKKNSSNDIYSRNKDHAAERSS